MTLKEAWFSSFNSANSEPWKLDPTRKGRHHGKQLLCKWTRHKADAARVLDISDPKWAHPEVIGPWVPDFGGDSYFNSFNPTLSIEERAEVCANNPFSQISWPMPDLPFDVDTYTAPGCPEEPETEVTVYVCKPKGFDEKKAKVLFDVPSGALALWAGAGSPIGLFMEATGAIVVMPRYRTSCQAEYPAAINDIHAAYAWMVDNADELGIDPDAVVLEGLSAGACLALAACFRLKRYGYRPRGVVAISPQTDDRIGGREVIYTGSFDSFAEIDAMRCYLGNAAFGGAGLGPEAVANHATIEDCAGYPPCFIHTGEFEPDADSNREFYGKR